MKDDHRTANIDRDILKLIFDRVSLHTSTCLLCFSVLTFFPSISCVRSAPRSAKMIDSLIGNSAGLLMIFVRTLSV